MDLFKFESPSGPTYLNQGAPIEGWKSARWVERYQEPGEFKLMAPLSSGLHDFLPEGTYISHVDTADVMIVENHQIAEDTETSPTLEISGRSIDILLEDRVIGCDEQWGVHGGLKIPYYIFPDDSRDQIVSMINDHIQPATTFFSQGLINMKSEAIAKDANHITDTVEERWPKRGPLLERVLELLKVDDLGLKFQRRGWLKPGNPQWDISFFYVHSGRDLSDRVIFSWDSGDIKSANYLFSRKKKKNAALITGTHVETAIEPAELGAFRRWMHVDATDVDSDLTAPLTGPQIADVKAILLTRGQEALKAQEEINVFDATLSDLTRFAYRKDYEIGDVVSVEGSFGERERRRVIEHVEVVDEDGTTAIPTLAAFNRQL